MSGGCGNMTWGRTAEEEEGYSDDGDDDDDDDVAVEVLVSGSTEVSMMNKLSALLYDLLSNC